MDYRDMTLWQLEQERQKIVAEVNRRHELARRARELGLGPAHTSARATEGGMMFYCESCRLKNGWPKSSSRWWSVCEMCGAGSTDCNDIPSQALPDRSDAAVGEGEKK